MAVLSFCFFAIRALPPLFPYPLALIGLVSVGFVVAMATGIVGLVLLGMGGIIGILSDQLPALHAFRQLSVGFGTTMLTYSLGFLFEAALA